MASAGRGRWHLGFAKPTCSIWIYIALYCMDISVPNSPKRSGDAMAGLVACNQRYCSRAAPDKSPYTVTARSFLLLLVGFPPLHPIGQKRSHWSLKWASGSGMNQGLPSFSAPGLMCGAQVLEACGGHAWGGATGWQQRPWDTMGQAPGQRCWQNLLPQMPTASFGAPGLFRAFNPQHYKQSRKLGIFVHGWVFFWACELHIF